MSKAFFKKYLPDAEKLKQHKNLQFLGKRLHEPNLWHLNRHSVAKAFGIGLFCAWIPSPTQMAFSAIAAFYLRANLPISVGLVWITNPITMPPLFYFAYRVGLWLLDRPSPAENFEFSIDGLFSGLGDIWTPFLLGCLIIGILCATIGFYGADYFWRRHIADKWSRRQQTRAGILLPVNRLEQIYIILQNDLASRPELQKWLSNVYPKLTALLSIVKNTSATLLTTLSNKDSYQSLKPIYLKSKVLWQSWSKQFKT